MHYSRYWRLFVAHNARFNSKNRAQHTPGWSVCYDIVMLKSIRNCSKNEQFSALSSLSLLLLPTLLCCLLGYCSFLHIYWLSFQLLVDFGRQFIWSPLTVSLKRDQQKSHDIECNEVNSTFYCEGKNKLIFIKFCPMSWS